MNPNTFVKQVYVSALLIAFRNGYAETTANALAQPAATPGYCNGAAVAPAPRCAKAPSADFDNKGRLWVSWAFQNRIYVQSSADGGRTLSGPRLVTRDPETILISGENRPKIKTGNEGQIYLTWSKSLEKGFSSDVRFSRSLDGGKTFSEPVTVNDDHQIIGHSFDSLAVSRSGKIFVAWLDARDAEAAKNKRDPYAGTALYYSWSGDQGQTFSPSIKAADHTCECCRLQSDVDIDGMPAVMWRSIFPGNIRDHSLVKMRDWNRPGTPVRVSHENWYIEGCPHQGPGLSIGGDGRYHMTWFSQAPDAIGLFYAQSDDMGVHSSKPMNFGDPKAMPSHADILNLGRRVDLVWSEFDGKKHRLKAMRSLDAGATWSEPSIVAETAGRIDYPFLHHYGDRVYVSFATTSEGLRILSL